MYESMLFRLSPDMHTPEAIRKAIAEHPEIRFVSLAAVDTYGNDTDERIPIKVMMDDIEGFLKNGVQTDGSSVLLPEIADLTNARVDLIPDMNVNWYVDYNFQHYDLETDLPVGTLRIPSNLLHNEVDPVGSRTILAKAEEQFKSGVMKAMKENPYVFEYMGIDSIDDIETIDLTAATEMEFYVMTPDDMADKEKLHTSQEMKEQYWKRTVGPVRTAMEECLAILEQYGFDIEMGHKEVGGVKPAMTHAGYDHIMEQLEIDWKYSNPMQASDSDAQIRYIIKDVFRSYGLNVTFMAKPVEGVAGSGKHTHIGARAILKNGKKVNIFSAKNTKEDFMSPVGFGALMGILKNYEIINPFVTASNDAFNRLKPGYEAPISVVTSLGKGVDVPSRNRTILIGLIRDINNSAATHFELRSPNPKSNTYLVLASAMCSMLDGIESCLYAHKTPADLEKSISKSYGEEDFYLEQNREYRTEKSIFKDYTAEDREKRFGKAPATVWENISALDQYPEKTALLTRNGVMTEKDLKSYKVATTDIWATEVHDRIANKVREGVRQCVKLHDVEVHPGNDLDDERWAEIAALKLEIAKDSMGRTSLLTQLTTALDNADYDAASNLQLLTLEKFHKLEAMYLKYKENLL